MRLKNAICKAGLTVAAVFLLAPAAANATEWWWFDHTQGRYPVSTFKKVVEPALKILQLKVPTGTVLGPCKPEGDKDFKIKGEIYSKFGGMGEGDLTQPIGTLKTCETTVAECTVKKIAPPANPAWKLTLVEKKVGEKTVKMVEISNFSLTVEKTGKCESDKFTLADEFTITGTIEGTWLNWGEGGAGVEFDEFKVTVGGTELRVEGYLGFGTEVTAKTEPTAFAPTYSPITLKGFQLESFVFTRGEASIECEESTLEGKGETADKTITVTPTFSECSTSGLPATVKMNGCNFLLHLESELVAGETYKYVAPTDLKCPEGKVVEIELFLSSSSHSSGSSFCKFTLGESGNQGRKTVELINQGSTSEPVKGWLETYVDVKELTTKRTGSLFCGPETDTSSTLEGKYKITGEYEELEHGIGVFPL